MARLDLDITHPLRAFELRVELRLETEILALVGPSGAGKTSVVRAIAGLLQPARGRISFDEQVWLDTQSGVRVAPESRRVGLVFQDLALFPHMSARENIAYGASGPVDDLVERFRLCALAETRPAQLSGGERQRVALARALARQPEVLLLDEPLSALDPRTRAHVREELRSELDAIPLPTLVVTHDFQDAAALADRVAVIVDGTIVQSGEPAELLASPASPFVADFTGANLLTGFARRGSDGLTEVELTEGLLVRSTDTATGRVGVIVYPWEIAVARDFPEDSTQNHVRGPIVSLTPVANRVRVRVGAITAEVTAASVERLALQRGDEVVASFKAAGTRLLSLDPSG